MPTAVTYSGRLAPPRTTEIACTADAKRLLATPITETPNSSWAYAPSPAGASEPIAYDDLVPAIIEILADLLVLYCASSVR